MVVALVLTFLIQTFLAKVYVIPSGSMETTLHGCTGCNNDRVLVDKVTYRFGDPEPGDVVVFRGPETWRNSEFTVEETANPLLRALQGLGSLVGLAPPDEKDFVKRVIAVGGQTVACCDPRNRVLVDGQPLDEPYIYYLPEAGPARQDAVRAGHGAGGPAVDDGRQPQQLGRLAGARPRRRARRERDRRGPADRHAVRPVPEHPGDRPAHGRRRHGRGPGGPDGRAGGPRPAAGAARPAPAPGYGESEPEFLPPQ